MRYASAAAFRQALEARLVALSRDGGLSLVRLRKSVAFDRLRERVLAREVELAAALTRGYAPAARLLDLRP